MDSREMSNKNKKRKRMYKYFIEATAAIIEEEGIDKLTIRKIADKAGYNSATIYNYFSELSHLIFFASMTFLKPYTTDFAEYIKRGKNPIEQYVLGWECFCKHSFAHPQLFHAIFIMDLGSQPNKLFEQYYDMYATDIVDFPDNLKPVLFQRNMLKRGLSLLEMSAKEDLIELDQIDKVNEFTTLVWQGMLTNQLTKRTEYTEDEATDTTMTYIREIVRNCCPK